MRRTPLCLAACLCLVISVPAFGREVGDIFYFKSQGAMWGWDSTESGEYARNHPGHAAVYLGSDENGQHWSVEALNPDQGVRINNRIVDQNGNVVSPDFLGYFSLGSPSSTQRRSISAFGYAQNGKAYADVPWLGTGGFVEEKGPDRFSCVGLAERCYEVAGVNLSGSVGPVPDGEGRSIVIGDPLYLDWVDKEETHYESGTWLVPNFWVFFPYSQLYVQTHRSHSDNSRRMTPSVSVAPTVTIVSPTEGKVLAPGLSAFMLRATATDGPNGSGIYKVEFFLDQVDDDHLVGTAYTYAPGGTPEVRYVNNEVPIDLPEYTVSWLVPTAEGSHSLLVRAWDRAGNASAVSTRTIRIDTVAPGKPLNQRASAGAHSVTVAWDAPQVDAEGNPYTDPQGYRVYRHHEGDTACPGPSTAFAGIDFCLVADEGDLNASAAQYVDTDVTSEEMYHYVVCAVDQAGNVGEVTDPVDGRPLDALWVPGTYSTIQEALTNARAGDVVMVRPGVYPAGAGLNISEPNVTLMSEGGPAATTLDMQGVSRVIVSARHGSRIVGFAFKNTGRAGTAIDCYFDFGVLVANNIFVSNRVGIYSGGNFVPPMIYNNTFVDNDTGVKSAFHGLADLRNNIFADNRVAASPDLRTVWYQGRQYTSVVSHNGFSNNTFNIQDSAGREIFGQFAANGNETWSGGPGFVGSGDYRLRPESDARNKGDQSAEMKNISSLDWTKDPDGTVADLGAFGGPYTKTWRDVDYDLDGIVNAVDTDDDSDCLDDVAEDINGNGVFELTLGETNPLDQDTDDDGLTDGNCGSEDLNANGIFEPQLGETDPRNADSDGDGLQDGTEKGLTVPESAETNLTVFIPDADPSTTTDPLLADSDGDGLLDGQEDANHDGAVTAGETDTGNADTDGDTFADGTEVNGGSDPLNPDSVPSRPPAIVAISVQQRADGSGLAEATFTGSDTEGDLCTLPIKEVSGDGVAWSALATVPSDPRHTASEPLSFSPEGSPYRLVWDARAAFGAVEDAEVFVRLQPHDGRLVGDLAVSGPFAVDTVPPRVTVSAPALSSQPVTPTISVSDGLDAAPVVTMTLDGVAWPGGTVTSQGHHTLVVTARDDFGNSATVSMQFVMDLTSPEVAFDGAVDGGIYGTDVTVSWRVSDSQDPAPAVAANFTSPHLFDFSGHYTVNVTATDAAGNALSRSLSFAIYDLTDLPAILGGMSIEAGLKSSLVSKIENALAAKDRGSVGAAVNLLEAFVHAVEAQRGKKIVLEDADMLADFAQQVIALLENSWSALSLGEVFLSADDPALATWGQVLEELETNAVSRVVLKVYRASGSGTGRLALEETAAWSGRGTLNFAPLVAFDLTAFLAEAERRGIDVLAGIGALSGGAAPDDAAHAGHLTDTAAYLLSAYPALKGICLMDLEAPGQAPALTELVASLNEAAVASSGHKLALLVGSPASDADLLSLSETKGQDLPVLGTVADVLYLGTVLEDNDANGLADHDSAWPGQVVSYVSGLNLSAGLVPLVPTYDVMEPFEDMNGNGLYDADEPFADLSGDGQRGVGVAATLSGITATVSGLPGASVCGIAVYSYGDTSAAEWSALLNSHPR